MLQSKLFTKIERSFPKDEESLNAKLLERGGLVYKNSAGAYSYLPLGWRVIRKISDRKNKKPSFNLSWTHEEIIAEIAKKYVSSYRDLPFAAYQIQTKFRREPRAKSGLLRGREFLMKDLYSFHASNEDMLRYYDEVAKAYKKVFERCGLKAFYTLAAGGDFTASNTHEFQVAKIASGGKR